MDLVVLMKHVIKLKTSLNSNMLNNIKAVEVLEEVSSAILAMAADLDLGMHNTLSDLNIDVRPYMQEFLNPASRQDVPVAIPNEIEIESDPKMKVANLTGDALRKAMEWNHVLRYSIEVMMTTSTTPPW